MCVVTGLMTDCSENSTQVCFYPCASVPRHNKHTTVRKWFFFGRYAAFLFLEVYINCFRPNWEDNVRFGWEADENYTIGAVHITHNTDREVLDKFLEWAKHDTADNAFAIETSLCAVAKFIKGTRWDGFYTERMMKEADSSPEYGKLIYECL